MVERRLVASGRHFALRVTGDSMQDAAICDGDVVIVRQQPVAQSGDIVVAALAARRNGETSVDPRTRDRASPGEPQIQSDSDWPRR